MRFKYCPQCGKKLILREIGDEGMIPYCEECAAPRWDMFTTSIIAAVINEYGEAALLRQDYVSKSSLVCVAGIMKPGETAEETVVREIREEIGQEVYRTRFVKSYAYPQKDMLMLGYRADVLKTDFVLSGEVDEAHWVPGAEALGRIREGSIAWQLVREALTFPSTVSLS